LIIAAAVISAFVARGQDKPVLTLDSCLEWAVRNYPTYRQFDLLQTSTDLKNDNLGKNYLPALNVAGQASYQSDVTKVPTYIPQFAPPAISKDWYKIYLDVSQVIWDGGATRQGKAVENADHEISTKNLELELYRVREQVNNVFFSILLLQENRKVLQIHADEIGSRLKDVESAVRNGLVLGTNADILKAELMQVEQKADEIDISVAAALRSLGLLIGRDIAEGTVLQMPAPVVDPGAGGEQRLEFAIYDLQNSKMEVMKKVSGTALMPKFQAFGQAGYGRPAYDMLSNDFEDYYIIGLRLNWNFWNWNKTRNEKQIFGINQQIITTQRDAFNQNLSIDLTNKRSEIDKYEKIIVKDGEILALRTRVVEAYGSRLENGVITATEYLTELNSESEARLNINIHKIQLIQATYRYIAAIGKL
jgi:outer membrane protein TolC